MLGLQEAVIEEGVPQIKTTEFMDEQDLIRWCLRRYFHYTHKDNWEEAERCLEIWISQARLHNTMFPGQDNWIVKRGDTMRSDDPVNAGVKWEIVEELK